MTDAKLTLKINKPLKIGYQGTPGSNAETATKAIVKRLKLQNVELVPLTTSQNVCDHLVEGSIDFGVMARQNSISGMISETLKAVPSKDLHRVTFQVVPINHCLFKLPDVPMNTLTTIASHEEALCQTKNIRARMFPQLNELQTEDTALSAKQLAEHILPETTAVLCSKQAGLQHNLDLVCEHVADKINNNTLFDLTYYNKDKEKLLKHHTEEYQDFVQAVQEQLEEDMKQHKRIGATDPTDPKWWLV